MNKNNTIRKSMSLEAIFKDAAEKPLLTMPLAQRSNKKLYSQMEQSSMIVKSTIVDMVVFHICQIIR